MTSLRPYPAYADTDLPWLPKIPKHWEAKPLFAVMKERQRKNIGNKETNVLSLSYGNIVRRDVESNFGLLPESFETYQIVQPGNIVMRLTDLQNDKRSLRTGQVKEQGIITSAYTCLEVGKQLDDNFAHYLLHGYDLLKVFYQLGAGVRQTMKFDDLKRLLVLVPSLEEQQAIAAYLDRQTVKIDALIAKKQRLLDLLAEQRAALISQAVTKGLNPAVEMKDSGVAWLGQVPSHWEVKRLKYACEINPSKTEIASINRNTEVSFLPMELVEPGYLRLETSKTLDDVWQGFTYFRDNDVVVAKITPCFENGKGAVAEGLVNGIGFGTTELHVLRSNASTLPKFIYYLTSSNIFHNLGEALMTGTAGQKRVPDSFLSNFYAPIPPVEEQAEIVSYIEGETKKLDSLSSKAEKVIERLQEYRAALISSVVTGKVQVKDLA